MYVLSQYHDEVQFIKGDFNCPVIFSLNTYLFDIYHFAKYL